MVPLVLIFSCMGSHVVLSVVFSIAKPAFFKNFKAIENGHGDVRSERPHALWKKREKEIANYCGTITPYSSSWRLYTTLIFPLSTSSNI